jgi:hypothetical protein
VYVVRLVAAYFLIVPLRDRIKLLVNNRSCSSANFCSIPLPHSQLHVVGMDDTTMRKGNDGCIANVYMKALGA